MAETANGRVVVNLTTGHEDADKVTVALDEGELVANARLAGATPLWEWIGDDATVFSY
jgi:hypothetical protein